ncbi:hypothetical protein OIDMADRAFT_178813 [Oidiodendron maius Zn]|uniref:Uncharacterized protein n=1 Tax=Oidiodendron maius (strain Zn) TaxID=913774 RepID=A0A0C3CVW3_OIDMZ|nr:hypothetical protein OIDMADRAFT_178813 [Oidiodendron maius Zn]
MEELVNAAETNDLDKLRHYLDLERAQNPQLSKEMYKSTAAMRAACHAAARNNHPAALDILLDSGCWIDRASIAGSKEVFDSLIARGWDINSRVGYRGDALMISAEIDNLDMIQFLLSRGADPNANYSGGMFRALEVAAFHASVPVLDALLNSGAVLKGRSALCNAAEQGRTDVVAYLLDRGAAINDIPDNPDILSNALKIGVKNALCEAAWRGQPAAVKLLLERGADTSVKDTNGRSALELAEMEGHESCISILKEYARVKSEE